METSKSARWSATRWSTPSYRPQMRIRCSPPASRRASRWVNSSPWGERRTAFPGPNRFRIASTPVKIGSGFITIPPPPPQGGSSVTPCFPCAYSPRFSPPRGGAPHGAASCDVDLGDDLGNHRKEGFPVLAPDDEPVVGRPLLHADELPEADPRGAHPLAADQVRDVVLALLRGRKLLPEDRNQGP